MKKPTELGLHKATAFQSLHSGLWKKKTIKTWFRVYKTFMGPIVNIWHRIMDSSNEIKKL